MRVHHILKIIGGSLILLAAVIRGLIFLFDPVSLLIYYRIALPEITVDNIAEAIAGIAIAAFLALIILLILLILTIVSIIIHLNIGIITIAIRKSKVVTIFGMIFTVFNIFMGALAIISLMEFDYFSFFIVFNFIIYIIVLGICIFSLIRHIQLRYEE